MKNPIIIHKINAGSFRVDQTSLHNNYVTEATQKPLKISNSKVTRPAQPNEQVSESQYFT